MRLFNISGRYDPYTRVVTHSARDRVEIPTVSQTIKGKKLNSIPDYWQVEWGTTVWGCVWCGWGAGPPYRVGDQTQYGRGSSHQRSPPQSYCHKFTTSELILTSDMCFILEKIRYFLTESIKIQYSFFLDMQHAFIYAFIHLQRINMVATVAWMLWRKRSINSSSIEYGWKVGLKK